MAFLVCLLFRESIGVAITKSFLLFVRKFFVSSIVRDHALLQTAVLKYVHCAV